jgi:hypothetical protein
MLAPVSTLTPVSRPTADEEGRLVQAPLYFVAASGRPLGKRGHTNRDQQVMAYFRSEHVVLFLKPDKLSFQVTYTLLKATHLRDHARIRPADVAIQSLRHCLRSSTLSDQSGRARIYAIISASPARK